MFVNLGELWGTLGGHLPQMFIVNVSYFKFFTLAKYRNFGGKKGLYLGLFSNPQTRSYGLYLAKGESD